MDGAYDGGSPVLDYQLLYTVYKNDEDDPDPTGELTYTVYQSGALTPFIVTSLTPGAIYSFKAASRNLVGLSDLSDAVQIQAA